MTAAVNSHAKACVLPGARRNSHKHVHRWPNFHDQRLHHCGCHWHIDDDITLRGGPDDVFIFQSTGSPLSTDKKVTHYRVAYAKNVI
jgi:hypothetical protein